MDDEDTERLGASHEFLLFEDLGRWVRDKDAATARHEQASVNGDDPAYQRFPEDQVEALISRALRARGPSRAVASKPVERPSIRRRIESIAYPLSVAAAVVATFMISVPRSNPQLERGLSSTPPVAATPKSFASMRIDGGGPSPLHQGPARTQSSPTSAQVVCQGRPLQLVLATPPGQTLDPAEPLEITLEATPPWGPPRTFTYDVGPNDRFAWVDGGRAAVFSGTLEELAPPLTPGPWALHVSAGAPGVCSRRGPGSGCSSLEVRTIEVVAREQCDARR